MHSSIGVPASFDRNGHAFNMAFKRSNMDISISSRHGAKVKLTSVFGAANFVLPLELRSKCVVCLMLAVISGRFGSAPSESTRWNSSSGTVTSDKTSLISARGIDTDKRSKLPMAFRCSSPSMIIGARISLRIGHMERLRLFRHDAKPRTTLDVSPTLNDYFYSPYPIKVPFDAFAWFPGHYRSRRPYRNTWQRSL